jgi:hypothetical protein
MTKIHIIIIILSALLFSCARQTTLNCESIKNGKFYYYTKLERERINIWRTDSVQIEAGLTPGETPLKNKIVWRNDCEFDLYLDALSETPLTGTDSIFSTIPTSVEIVYIGKDYYVCKVRMKVYNKKIVLTDTMYYIK